MEEATAVLHLATIATFRSDEACRIADWRRAARLLGYANTYLSIQTNLDSVTEQQECERTRKVLEQRLGATELEAQLAMGAALTLDELHAEAFLL